MPKVSQAAPVNECEIFRSELKSVEKRSVEQFARVDERFEDLTTVMIAGFDRIYEKIEIEVRVVSDIITGLGGRITELAKNRVTYDDHQRDITRVTKRVEHIEDIIARNEL